MVAQRVAECDHLYCDGCGADIGRIRKAAHNSDRFLDLSGSAVMQSRMPRRPGEFMIGCECGHVSVWQGFAVRMKR